MKKIIIAVMALCLVAGILADGTPGTGAVSKGECTFRGIRLYGRVKVVDRFPDIKVQVVTSFPDLKVQVVNSFPDRCGKWQIVSSFPDFKIQYVSSFPDIKIMMVNSFPGIY